MSPRAHTPNTELDESAWVYLGVARRNDSPGVQPFAEMLADACRRFGFAVYASTESDEPDDGPPLWVDAVRHAEVCVIDVGAATAVTGAELATAYCARRPIVALRGRDDVLPAPLASLADHYGVVREVLFDNAQDCVDQLIAVFGDPSWQQAVRSATSAESM